MDFCGARDLIMRGEAAEVLSNTAIITSPVFSNAETDHREKLGGRETS